MKTVKFLLISLALLFVCATMQAQFGKVLGKAVENAAKNATIRKAEQKTDNAVSKSIDKATDTKTYKGNETNSSAGNNENGEAAESSSNAKGTSQSATTPKALEMAYSKSDFVPGDEIIFDDPMDNEQLGEFPSQWDLLSGNCEVVSIAGKKAFELTNSGYNVTPLMKNPKNFLGDVFTIEFDFLAMKDKSDHSIWVTLRFWKPDAKSSGYPLMDFSFAGNIGKDGRYKYDWDSSNNRAGGSGNFTNLEYDKWHHFAISFNKRAWKFYVDGVRLVNVPNVVTPPGWFDIFMDNVGQNAGLEFTNFRIAKGAVPLYDRLSTDGKIVTYGITFDVGKSVIKPESMPEINRIVQLMKDNSNIKFSVEGHTDNTGNAASNQTLSEARSKAIMDKLVESGIAADRLKAVGKGQTSPIADNSTDEGRAKNRRVEFVKIN